MSPRPVSTRTKSTQLFEYCRTSARGKHASHPVHPSHSRSRCCRKCRSHHRRRDSQFVEGNIETGGAQSRGADQEAMVRREIASTRVERSPRQRPARRRPRTTRYCKRHGYGPGRARFNPPISSSRRGEIVGICRLAGIRERTELARLLFGLDSSDGGDIVVNEQANCRCRKPGRGGRAGPRALSRKAAQTEGVIADLSVRENIVLGAAGTRDWCRINCRAELRSGKHHDYRRRRYRTCRVLSRRLICISNVIMLVCLP